MLTKEQLDDLRWRMQGSTDHESDWRIVEDALRMQREAIFADPSGPNTPPINRWATLTRLVDQRGYVTLQRSVGGHRYRISGGAGMTTGRGDSLDAALDDATTRDKENL